MPKPTLSSYLRDHLDAGRGKKEPGPFVTISCERGCDGYELGLLLAEKLNERDEQQRWRVYYKEFIQQLSEDTGVDVELLEKEHVSKPSVVKDFLRGLHKNPVPDRIEIRNQTARMMRTVAVNGYGIMIGHGGAAATSDIANGVFVRIEAPRDWRIARVCQQESLARQAAAARIDQFEAGQAMLRTYYDQKKHRKPEYHLVMDNSQFSKEILSQIVLLAMEEKNMIEKLA